MKCPKDGKEKTEEDCRKEKCSELSTVFHVCRLIFQMNARKLGGDDEKERKRWEEIHGKPYPSPIQTSKR